jgi:SAM-dependent methyltransferase
VAGERGFDGGYRRWRASRRHAALLGQGMPPEIEPFSFVPLEGLKLLATLAGPGAGRTLVDLGCGRGGPGLWLAQRLGADLIGADGSAVAVSDASDRKRLFPGTATARFLVTDVTRTGLAGRCADLVVCIDVLQVLEDHGALLAETARLLKPGGRALITTWEGRGTAPRRFPRDLRRMIADAGLRSGTLIEQPAWLERQLRIYQSAAAAASHGDPALADLAAEGHRWQSWHTLTRRVVITAQHTLTEPAPPRTPASADARQSSQGRRNPGP